MPSGIDTGALLDRARTDLARPDASPVDLRRHLTRVVPAVEELLAENAALHGQLARARTCPVTHLPTRAAWTERAGQVLAQGPTVVLLVDLDHVDRTKDVQLRVSQVELISSPVRDMQLFEGGAACLHPTRSPGISSRSVLLDGGGSCLSTV
ncbi:hypothetical protein [Streptomyces silvensis]|uniref:hypothetical protein n=1 Tax=Streptomyces silvensis TaxID=1765722 RepID=UPI000AC965FA|nr:hypothetical protein [Streptomyces silvensis]